MLTKIRILLLVLTLTLIGTGLTIHFTTTEEDILELDQKELTETIHKYETRIDELWQDSLLVKTFQNAEKYPLQVAEITDKTAKEYIFFFIYKHHELVHWSSNVYVPVTDLGVREGTSFIQSENRSFLFKKKELANNVTVLAMIPLKRDFDRPNTYLQNSFQPVVNVNNIEIAKYDDNKNIRNIYSKDKNYLFSVKLIDGKKDNIFINLQLFCWMAAFICIFILSYSLCLQIAKKGNGWISVLIFAAILLSIRYIDLRSNWLSIHSSFQIFDAKLYAYNEFLPNMWAFVMTSISIFGLIVFIKVVQKKLTLPSFFRHKIVAIFLSFLAVLSIHYIGYNMYYYMGTLLTHSPLHQYDFTRLLNLGTYGWLCALIGCINITAFILYIDNIVLFIKNLLSNITLTLNIELICIVIALVSAALLGVNILLFIFFGFLIFIRSYLTYNFSQPYRLSIFIASILLLSAISVIIYNSSTKTKKIEHMKQSISHLLAEDDTNAISLFIDIENNIKDDIRLNKLLNLHSRSQDMDYLMDYLKTRYAGGYLSRFDFRAYFYDNEGESLSDDSSNKATEYREKVIKGAIKIPATKGFYRLRSSLGAYEYFTHIAIPYENDPERFYHVYLDFKNVSYSTALPYPELLTDNTSSVWQQNTFLSHSYALYRDGVLITQYGTYNYPERSIPMAGDLQKYLELNLHDEYYHLAFKPDEYTSIILSTNKPSIWEILALGSTFFILLLVFFSLYNMIHYLLKTISDKSFHWIRIKYHFRQFFNNIQYSTRIQSLVIISVLLGVLISGAIAFLSINRQLESNQADTRLKEIAEITKKIEISIGDVEGNLNEKIKDILTGIAATTVSNFNLYDKSGKLLYSSQPRIFDLKLLSEYMNPKALTKLAVLHRSEAYERERISDFWYTAAYSSIKDEEYRTVAYLSTPHYSSIKDTAESKNLLLNTILNIYTVIIILFGFIAVAVSSKITEPLNIVREKLAATQLSDKINEPLYWERNDEIGMLIKEYNYMLVKLEESAKQLRDVERETAWREMAKQVAHEIKNPLTPMKLGIQQLIRSYNENDSRFKERFDRISHSIIEQIDSLSKIATEFSAFAKLPETNMVKINLIEKIQKVINLFSGTSNVTVVFINKTGKNEVYILGDRDQTLRSFNNLIKNAIEASVGRKKIKIHVTLELTDNNWVKVFVTDNGYGISPEALPNLFKPNFTTKSSGTGLGLAFVKQTVTAIGGKIEFVTKTNVGTSFIISLPPYEEEENKIKTLS